MGLDRHIPLLRLWRQGDGDGRRQLARLAPTFQRQAHGVGVRDAAAESLRDGALQFLGPIAIQQPHQFPGDGAEVVATLERRFGRKLNASVEIDPELIGGIRAVVGDEVLDTSVKARLEQMKLALTA